MEYNFLRLIFILLCVGLQVQCRTIREVGHGRIRTKRQQCQLGYGYFEERQCCKCPHGFHVKVCKDNGDTECEECVPGSTYLDHANLLDSCERCKVCDPKANMETEKDCIEIQNTICRCMKGFYCDKLREECTACHSCKKCEGDFVIEKECTSTNNTVCKKAERGGPWWIVFIVIPPFVIAGSICYLKKQKRLCFGKPKDEGLAMDKDKENNVDELTPLRGKDLVPLLSSIVEELGPKLITDLVRGDISDQKMEFHEEDAHNNAKEKSYRILKDWCELQGLEKAAPNLIQKLNEMGKNTIADKVKKIIEAEKESQ